MRIVIEIEQFEVYTIAKNPSDAKNILSTKSSRNIGMKILKPVIKPIKKE